MYYGNLPSIGELGLPELPFQPTSASSARAGVSTQRVVFVHRWGGGSFGGVVSEFLNPANEASAHIVYAGEHGPDAGRAVQMVELARKAWTEANYNSVGLSIESADAIWLGEDPHGFARLARMVAWLLHHEKLPAHYVDAQRLTNGWSGFARHADGGQAGGGHTACPTTDHQLWGQFVGRVVDELAHGAFRDAWAR